MTHYAAIFALSLLLNFIVLKTARWHGKYSYDRRKGVQKFHIGDTTRIGGVAIYAAFLLFLPFYLGDDPTLALIVLSAIPLFIGAIIDDLNHAIGWMPRLALIFLSSLIYVVVSGEYVPSLDAPLLDIFMRIPYFPHLLTIAAISAIATATNIIDGFNGLASGALLIMFGGLAVLAWRVGDQGMVYFALLHIAVILGFMVFNFPTGRIFLGDAGAYYLGFALAIGVVHLIIRNPSLSPWTATLLVAYPVVELLFSFYRKFWRKGHSPTRPDRVHLHMLIYRSMARRLARFLHAPGHANSVAGAIMWLFPLISGIGAQLGLFHSYLSMALLFAFFIGYIAIYRRVSFSKRGLFGLGGNGRNGNGHGSNGGTGHKPNGKAASGQNGNGGK